MPRKHKSNPYQQKLKEARLELKQLRKQFLYLETDFKIIKNMLVGEARKAKKQLRELVDKLDQIHKDPNYSGVLAFLQAHGYLYKGPSYADELEKARTFVYGTINDSKKR